MKIKAYAFISYQTSDKLVAGKLKDILSAVGVDSFLAHEDIEVSEEWRVKILEEISKADIFIPVLSKDYYESLWCVQEAGIAAYRNKMTIIPLSIDGNIPKGFIGHIQSTKIKPDNFDIKKLLPGFLKHDFSKGIELIIEIIGDSSSFRGAEANFQLILPHIPKMNDKQIKLLLEKCESNGQVWDAALCKVEYIPPLLKSHGHLLNKKDFNFLKGKCEKWT